MEKLELIDVHSHIHFPDFKDDIDEVIKRALCKNVRKIITSTLTFNEINEALRLKERFESIVEVSIGARPDIFDIVELRKIMNFIKTNSEQIIGIGEVGLDFYSTKGSILREVQKQNLILWIKLAMEVDKPLIIHSRWSSKHVAKIISAYTPPIVVFHAFDGSPELAKKLAHELEAYFSIPPSIKYSIQKRKLVEQLPIEKILLESDAPLLAPELGTRNEPANVVFSAEEIAKIKELTFSEVVEITTKNAKKVFKFKGP